MNRVSDGQVAPIVLRTWVENSANSAGITHGAAGVVDALVVIVMSIYMWRQNSSKQHTPHWPHTATEYAVLLKARAVTSETNKDFMFALKLPPTTVQGGPLYVVDAYDTHEANPSHIVRYPS